VSTKKITIGFDRYIERQWLEQTAEWVVQDATKEQLHENIDQYLAPYINGATSLRKSKNVLFGVWFKTDKQNQLFKEQAKRLYQTATAQEKLVIHWGLAVASYPFFASVVRLLGRLFRLQDDIHSKELIRRAVEQHGDTESVRRAATRLLQSLAQWGAVEAGQQSVFHPVEKIVIDNPELLCWLMTALFYSTDRERYSTEEIMSDPAWFPFGVSSSYFDVSKSKLLEIVHQNVGDTLIALKSRQ
jgi:hypothetical protein